MYFWVLALVCALCIALASAVFGYYLYATAKNTAEVMKITQEEEDSKTAKVLFDKNTAEEVVRAMQKIQTNFDTRTHNPTSTQQTMGGQERPANESEIGDDTQTNGLPAPVRKEAATSLME